MYKIEEDHIMTIPLKPPYTNRALSQLLQNVSAAYLILGENRFKIIAYDKAAESIEHLTSEVKDLWQDGKLDQIPGIGKTISTHLDELFRTGDIKHFDEILSKVPSGIFPLLLVPGIGPKKAYRLVTELKLDNADTVVADLEKAAHDNKIATMEGFGQKSQDVILSGIDSYKKGQIKENRLNLPEADNIAQEIVRYLSTNPAVKRVDLLGSLRRQVSTIGDIDVALITDKPEEVVSYFVQFPHERIVDQGNKGATLLLHNGRQVDLRVQDAKSYGAMLQYFTGSKHHNIHLRTYALDKHLSLSEHGIKNTDTGEITEYSNEKDFYHALGLEWIPPEMREDRGEIEAAIRSAQAKDNGLPHLVELKDIKGDLHMHTNYMFPTSHDIGQSHVHEHLSMAESLGYEYIGISDHNPKIHDMSVSDITNVMEKRYGWYHEQFELWKKNIQKNHNEKMSLFVMCEVDILVDGKLALPKEAFEYVDAVVVSLHSSFRQPREDMTNRICTALAAHPKVRIFGHPTGRLLLQREGVDANWDEVMKLAKERDIALEINAYPDRLDLPDTLVRDAAERDLKFCIDTDAHEVQQMRLIPYGISVARRGWAEKRQVVNTKSVKEFSSWLLRS